MKFSQGLLMGLLLVGVFGTSAFADSKKVVEVSNVQKWIQQSHADWQAKETWISQLPKNEAQRMMGLEELPTGTLDFDSFQLMDNALPKSIDWRNVNGVNWVGPMLNQGNCGSCVAFAAVGTLETQMSISSGLPWLRPTLSPQALFACGGGRCDYGWYPSSAASYLKSRGVPDEACLPYTSGSTGEDVACSNQCSDSTARSVKIAGSSTPSSYGGNAEAVKKALLKGPLITSMTVYADFVTYAGGIYKNVSDEVLGGHAIGLFGYDDDKRAWLIRNSWGPEWGEKGFAWVSYDDTSKVSASTWALQLGPSKDYLTVGAPADREYVSGTLSLSALYLGEKALNVRFRLKDPDGHELGAIPCTTLINQGCSAQLDTSQLKGGRYEVFAESITSSILKSQVREFFVLNSEPQMSVSFAAAQGIDLSKPLKGRAEFVIHTQSSPVPIERIEFRVIDSGGKLVLSKNTDTVLNEMKLGWRTQSVPNGQYQILFRGVTMYQGKAYTSDSNSFAVNVKN